MPLLKTWLPLLLLALLTGTASGADGLEFDGECPNNNMLRAFELNKADLEGPWYEYAKYRPTLNGGYACRRDTYKVVGPNRINFETEVLREVPVGVRLGYMVVTEPQMKVLKGRLQFKPGSKFVIKYDKEFTKGKPALKWKWKKLKVIYLDDHFCIMWLCKKSKRKANKNEQQLVILTRDANPANEHKDEMSKLLLVFDLNEAMLSKTRQNCTYA